MFVIMLVVGIGLFLFGLWQFKSAGRQLRRIEKDLEDLATHLRDGTSDEEV